MIRVIDKVSTFPSVNKKVAELCHIVKDYEGCLLTDDDKYKEFIKIVRINVLLLNERYPRTRAFKVEVYSDYLRVYIDGNTEQQVVRVYMTQVTGALYKGFNRPIENFMCIFPPKGGDQ